MEIAVSHVGICTSDLNRSIRFYTEALHFKFEYCVDVGQRARPGRTWWVSDSVESYTCHRPVFTAPWVTLIMRRPKPPTLG